MSLTQRTGDPLTVHVARQLVQQAQDPDPARSRLALTALRTLHLALNASR